jgi:hypothetical protein
MAMAVPAFSHIVVVVEENKDYSEIIGNPQAPYINSLAADGALLDNFTALTHPSEPNYFALYAGSTFGLTADATVSEPDPTLATILQGAGQTFTGWVEHPNTDSDHNPWRSFPEGTSVEQDFAGFPTTNFASLPTVSFVIPNVNDDMHNGTIAQGDSWLQANIAAYAQWAANNNSLLVVVWDEADTSSINQIPAILYGADVVPGDYNTAYNDYNLLSTILGAYNLTSPNNAAGAAPIAVFNTGPLGPTGPGPSDAGGVDGETIGFSIAGPVIINAQDNPLSLSAAGTVTAIGAGIDGVDSALGSATVSNDGTISSAGGFGVNLSGSGTIKNGPRVGAPALISGGAGGIRISGAGAYVENWGSITGGNAILIANGGTVNNRSTGIISGSSFGIFLYSNNPGTVYNYGSIAGANSAGILLGLGGNITNLSSATISGGSDAIYVQYRASGTVINTGSIQGNGGSGVDLGGGGSVTNNAGGTICGSQFGVFIGLVTGMVTNAGVITGTASDGIVLAAGGNVYNNGGGTITGGSNGVYVKYRGAGTVTNVGTITAANGAGIDLADGGTVSNAPSGSISGQVFGVFIAGGSGAVTNNGAITGASYDGVLLADGGTLINAAGATIVGGTNAVYVKYRAAGTVTNAGSISAHGGAGVDLSDGGTVTNLPGASISGDAIGVFITSAAGSIANSGTISGATADGVVLGAGGQVANAAGAVISGGGNGVYLKTGATGTVTNSGNISSAGAGIDLAQGGSVINNTTGSISGSSFGVFATSATTVINAGSIISTNNIAVDLLGGGDVTNTGAISAPGFGIAVYNVGGTVTNTGTISGGIDAVRFFGVGGNRMVVEPTAVLNGSVVAGGNSSTNTIELAGGTGSISGLSAGSGSVTETGQSWAFSGFGALTFDAGANWTMSGADSVGMVSNAGTLQIAGTLAATGGIDPSTSGLFMLAVGSILEVAAALGTPQITFLAPSSLLIDAAANFGSGQGSSSYVGPLLESFGANDTIDIKDFAAGGTSLSYDTTSGLLQLTNGTKTADLEFQVSTLGSGTFHSATDGNAGILITLR